MSLVLDASLAVAWFFEDEETEEIDDVLDRVRLKGAMVPSLWRLEVANALQMSVRRGRMTQAYRDDVFEQLGALRIDVDPQTDAFAWDRTVRLSDRFGLTVYDAAYLELAVRLDLPIATLDKALAAAARNSNLDVLGAGA